MSGAEGKKKSRGPQGPRIGGGTLEGRLLAAAILEVLAGMRTPTDAARALTVSVPRYYALEARGLEGLVLACEPRGRKGRRRNPEREVERLRKEVERLEKECARRQALLRAASRAVGLGPASAKPDGKRRRRPVVRALKAAGVLRSGPESGAEKAESSAS